MRLAAPPTWVQSRRAPGETAPACFHADLQGVSQASLLGNRRGAPGKTLETGNAGASLAVPKLN